MSCIFLKPGSKSFVIWEWGYPTKAFRIMQLTSTIYAAHQKILQRPTPVFKHTKQSPHPRSALYWPQTTQSIQAAGFGVSEFPLTSRHPTLPTGSLCTVSQRGQQIMPCRLLPVPPEQGPRKEGVHTQHTQTGSCTEGSVQLSGSQPTYPYRCLKLQP